MTERQQTSPLGADLGKFEIIERLGAGGMGSVYLAYDPELDRKLAVKVVGGETDQTGLAPGSSIALREISPGLVEPDTEMLDHRGTPQSDASAELVVEARAMAQLSHPNVVSIYEIGSAEGQVFIAMELVDGMNLREWLAAGARSRADILDAFRQAAAGLAAAHAAGLVHRDFKPENVLIDATGSVQVADFGLALDAPRGGELVRVGRAVAGTPGYIAPEVLEGGAPTLASDVYSFCVALLEALGGERPQTPLDSEGALKLVRSLGALPRKLRDGLSRGLQADPAARPEGGAGLVQMLATQSSLRVPIIAAVVVAGVAGAALAFAATRSSQSACTTSWDRLDSTWNAEHAALVRERIAALPSPKAAKTADELLARLDRGAQRLRSARSDVCKAREAKTIDEVESTARMRCVEETLSSFSALVDTLSAEIEAGDLDRLVALADPQDYTSNCTGQGFEGAAPLTGASFAIRRDWERAQLDRRLGNITYKDQLARIDAFLEMPEVTADKQLHAELSFSRWSVLRSMRRPDAKAALRDAATTAAAAGDMSLEVRATVELAFEVIGDRRFDEAETLLSLASARLPKLVARPEIAARFHQVRSRLRSRQGRASEALTELATALEALHSVPTRPHGLRSNILRQQAAMLYGRFRVEEALAVQNEIIALERAAHEPDHHDILFERAIVAKYLVNLGRLDEGFATFDEVIAKLTAQKHALFLRTAKLGLAKALLSVSRYRESRDLHIELIETSSKAGLPAQHDRVGSASRLLGDHETAEKHAQIALKINIERFGEVHADVGRSWRYLASVARSRGDFDEAERRSLKAKAIRTEVYGPNHKNTRIIDADLAKLKMLQGRCEEAIPAMRAVQARHAVDRASERLRGMVAADLGRCLVDIGEFAEAIETLTEALEKIDTRHVDPAVRAWHRFHLGRALYASGDRETGRKHALDALAAVKAADNWTRHRAPTIATWLAKNRL